MANPNPNPATRFQPGQSGNPTGRPKVIGEVQDLARQHTTEAIETLVAIMRSEEQPAAARVSAAQAILDRGYGKPGQTVSMDANVTHTIISEAERAAFGALAELERHLPRGNHPAPTVADTGTA